MTNRERAELLKEVLKPCLKKSYNADEWMTYRYTTKWGTKTEEGLTQIIERICFSDDENLKNLS